LQKIISASKPLIAIVNYKGEYYMSKRATNFQKKFMSRLFRGKGIFKPLNTGFIDEHVASIREWVAHTSGHGPYGGGREG
jgi:hypothetical protein